MSYAEDRYLAQQTRGGRRPGSGRKKLGHVPLMLYISAEADKAIRSAALRLAITPSRLVEKLVFLRFPEARLADQQIGLNGASCQLKPRATNLSSDTLQQIQETKRWAAHRMRGAESCVYCGDWYECRDHYVPVSWLGLQRHYTSGDCVPCCQECNLLLGNVRIFDLSQRALFLGDRYQITRSKVLNLPNWSDEELKEIGYSLCKLIKRGLMLQSIYFAKLGNLGLRALGYEPVKIGVEDAHLKAHKRL
jgi:hypothetical protein